SKKVFKWKTAELAPGASLPIRRSVTLQHLSTRRIHAGSHSVAVQVNGAEKAAVEFEVTD
ncbi:MAG: DNA alkylation repair protein, partial [Acidimicrobiia bacterium]|nr:DNA alkylation repair protein [Acidimicrobiia bacterium]